jgi:probable phosphoglycerate mutase
MSERPPAHRPGFDPLTAAATLPLLRAPFYYLRHGETTSNRDALIAGSLDVELTDTGRRQAQEAGRLLAMVAVGAIVASSRRRALDTAALVARMLGRAGERPLAITALDERHWGSLEGQPRAVRRYDALPADVEPGDAFARRVCAGLARVPVGSSPHPPLIVAHAGTWRVLCRLLGLEAAAEPIANALPVRVTPVAGAWRVERLGAD